MSKRKMITVTEAAEALDKSSFTIWRHIKTGVLEAKSFPKTAKFPARTMVYEDTLPNAELVAMGRPVGSKNKNPPKGPTKKYIDVVERLMSMGHNRLASEVAKIFLLNNEDESDGK
jgi:predicted DNA-binding transcriptional regulator AlpA